ncbi:hypothetical protein OH77DRAFT_1449005 [Trametes cingulata]|nr:hypothetical protein OH77DRAFT_1449005 [Trametes cingulata]
MGGMVASQPLSPVPSPTGTVRSRFHDPDADVICCSSDGVDFRLYKVVLAKASPVFPKMFISFACFPAYYPSTPHIVLLIEDADTLENLLRLCYPLDRPVFKQPEDLAQVLAAAKKYDIPAVIRNLSRDLASSLANSYGLPEVPRDAARLLLSECQEWWAGSFIPPEVSRRRCRALIAYQTGTYHHEACVRVAHVGIDDTHWLLFGEHPHKVTYSEEGHPDLTKTWLWPRCSTCMPLAKSSISAVFAVSRRIGIWYSGSGGSSLSRTRAIGWVTSLRVAL